MGTCWMEMAVPGSVKRKKASTVLVSPNGLRHPFEAGVKTVCYSRCSSEQGVMHLIATKRGSAAGVIHGACQALVVGNPRTKRPSHLMGQEEMYVPGAWVVKGSSLVSLQGNQACAMCTMGTVSVSRSRRQAVSWTVVPTRPMDMWICGQRKPMPPIRMRSPALLPWSLESLL